MQAVWPGVAVTDDSLVQCVHEIRRALRDDRHALLKTAPKRGYRLSCRSKMLPKPLRIRQPCPLQVAHAPTSTPKSQSQ